MSDSVYILLVKKIGKKKKDKRLVTIKTVQTNQARVELLAGTLLVAAPTDERTLSQSGGGHYESLETGDEVYCSRSEIEELSASTCDLLRPIPTCAERLEVYKNKEWLQEGLLLRPGDNVFVKIKGHQSELPGLIRYRGPVPDGNGVFFGIELTENSGEGTTDGVYRKKRLFQTHPDSGVFCPLHKIRKQRESWLKSDRARVGQKSVMSSLEEDILHIGERVMWPSDNGNEYGTVRWIGHLPGDTSGEKTVGVEFDNPIGTGTGKYKDQRLFYTKQGHASLVPLMGLIKDDSLSPPAEKFLTAVEMENPEFRKEQEKLMKQFQGSQGARSSSNCLQEEEKGEYSKHSNINPNNAPQKKSDLVHEHIAQSKTDEHFWKPVGLVDKVEIESATPQSQQLGLLDVMPGMGEESGLNPLYVRQYQESLDRNRDGKQSSASSTSSSVPPDPDLVVGSMVEVLLQGKPPLYGVIKWIGTFDDQTNKVIAGLEMEEEISAGTDGTFKGKRLFSCAPHKAFFVPLNKCRKDKRFQGDAKRPSQEEFGTIETPDIDGEICPPDVKTPEDLLPLCGKSRGIQGHHNSCYLDATLFSMFYFTTVFDFIFNEPPRPDSVPEHQKVQKVLKEGIVNPLRRYNYVRADKVLKLRELLDKLGTIPGMMGEEKDPEEFLSALLSQVMKADPLLHLSSGEHTYFYQLFLEKDEKLLLPTTQILVELSFLQGNVKLKEVPSCLMLQMPRFGKDYKMYRRIIPSLELDITDILETGIRECIVCGSLARFECKDCHLIHGQGLSTTAFCATCIKMSHQHKKRQTHHPKELMVPPEFLAKYSQICEESGPICRQNGEPLGTSHDYGLPKEKMELFAVLCIQTSHYVSFVKCGLGKEAPWVFFDSMADRMGEQGGYNIPEVQHVPELSRWLSEDNFQAILDVEDDKNLPEHMRRLLCDAYMCMYQSPTVMMFR